MRITRYVFLSANERCARGSTTCHTHIDTRSLFARLVTSLPGRVIDPSSLTLSQYNAASLSPLTHTQDTHTHTHTPSENMDSVQRQLWRLLLPAETARKHMYTSQHLLVQKTGTPEDTTFAQAHLSKACIERHMDTTDQTQTLHKKHTVDLCKFSHFQPTQRAIREMSEVRHGLHRWTHYYS